MHVGHPDTGGDLTSGEWQIQNRPRALRPQDLHHMSGLPPPPQGSVETLQGDSSVDQEPGSVLIPVDIISSTWMSALTVSHWGGSAPLTAQFQLETHGRSWSKAILNN